jgi:hypothetical protein
LSREITRVEETLLEQEGLTPDYIMDVNEQAVPNPVVQAEELLDDSILDKPGALIDPILTIDPIIVPDPIMLKPKDVVSQDVEMTLYDKIILFFQSFIADIKTLFKGA